MKTLILIALCIVLTSAIRVTQVKEDLESIKQYWTKERIEKAIPLDVPILNKELKIEGTFKNNHTAPLPKELVDKFPYKCAGKLLMHNPKTGTDHSCTASSAGGRVVATAGHCVTPGREKFWYEKVLFIPQYYEGNAPAGKWPAVTILTTDEWWNNQYLGRDVAFFTTPLNEDSKSLSEVVGAITPVFSKGRDFEAHLIGYPKNIGDTQVPIRSIGKIEMGDRSYNPPTMAVNSAMTFGASGGPWIINGRNLYGTNSYINYSRPDTIFASYFDARIELLYQNAQRAK
jgi:V8-like Glu-specific endopeptidase